MSFEENMPRNMLAAEISREKNKLIRTFRFLEQQIYLFYCFIIFFASNDLRFCIKSVSYCAALFEIETYSSLRKFEPTLSFESNYAFYNSSQTIKSHFISQNLFA